ncbi:Maltose acetyltransferase [Arthrobotrys musiformis]|uniref:Maltose acetyltransferase n=1 Tax=Arthrobotrys musiformis TaxID=47236 RepID=A0AAV9VU35_9PEZI
MLSSAEGHMNSKINGAGDGTSAHPPELEASTRLTATAVTGNSSSASNPRPAEPTRLVGPSPPLAPQAHPPSRQPQTQSNQHYHNAHHDYHSQTATQNSQSSSKDKEASDHSDITGSNLQSPITPDCHPDLKYVQAPISNPPLFLHLSGSLGGNIQKRKISKLVEASSCIGTCGQIREMSTGIVHPQYHGHSMPMTNDTRMDISDGRRPESTSDHQALEQRASEDAVKFDNMRSRDPDVLGAHVASQSDYIPSHNPNISSNVATINGNNPTIPDKPETKRKRVFSNRTKTGCITCRQRKKKCDEGKPHCDNCKRGGFTCGGYTAPINVSFATVSTPVMITSQERYQRVTSPDYTRHQPPQPPRSTTMPLQASPFSGPRVLPQPPLPQRFSSTEKERMLNGNLFHAFTPELIEERERCRAACWRFNNAVNPTLCISREEKLRLQMEIFRPSAGTGSSRGTVWHGDIANAYPTRNLGMQNPVYPVNEEPWIEAPFMCDYGYNITLGSGVLIDPGCTIIDTCSVTIKARTLIGPNVNIYSGTRPLDPRTRNGTKGPESGKPVTIEEDCWVAGNVTILPGVKIGRGATVGAGAVVTRDVPPFTVVGGNPAKVIRGIMGHE